MRRLNRNHDVGSNRERGAVAVVTAILMVVLLGFTALAVDGGMLYAKRAQLQNGADAAAIAVAQKCAASLTDPLCSSTSSLATSLAQSNTAAGQGGISSLAISSTSRTVTATTQALEPGSQPGSVALYFARALGIDSASVGAKAQAAWGSPSTGIAPFPLSISVCQVKDSIDGGYQLLQDHGTGFNLGCTWGTSGQLVPGGFGWLKQDPLKCGATINIDLSQGGSDPGNNPPSNCDGVFAQWFASLQSPTGNPPTVLIPVFTAVTGTGNSAIYTLKGFAAFEVLGWKFSGGNSSTTPPYYVYNNQPKGLTSLWCSSGCRGIIGKFVRMVTLDNTYQVGAPNNFGATIVRLTQ